MLKPLELKVQHTYKYTPLDEDGLKELYDSGCLNTTFRSKNTFVNHHTAHPNDIIRIVIGGGTYGVTANDILVLQYNQSSRIDGLLAFETEDKMLEFFNKVEE